VTNLVASQLELHRLATGREPRVQMAMTRLKQRLFQYMGYVSAALVLGGVDTTGSHLYTVYPHGSVDKLPFATMGSGSLAAMAVFEAGYKDDLTEAEAVELVNKAIQAGVFNDLGSGSNVDIKIIRKPTAANNYTPTVEYRRGYAKLNERQFRRTTGYEFKLGSTEWLKDTERFFKSLVDIATLPSTAEGSDKTEVGLGTKMET
jgi:20S proteasome subunit beta 2